MYNGGLHGVTNLVFLLLTIDISGSGYERAGGLAWGIKEL
jgi:hypothetical protein